MKLSSLLIIILIALVGFKLSAQSIQPPVTKKGAKVFSKHGNTRTDDYYWLNTPSDSNVINHLKEENTYVENYMKHTEALQHKLYDELVARIPGKDESLPAKKNGYWYYTRFEEGQQYPYYARKKETTTKPEEVFLNTPELAKNHKIYLVRGWNVSTDNNELAYGIDTSGDRLSTLFIKNISANKLSSETISNTSGNYAWANDNKTLYYVLNDNTVRPYKVMKHTAGSDPNTDKEIYTERDSTYSIYLSKSKNNQYIFIHTTSTNTNEDRYIDAKDPDATPVIIEFRHEGIEYTTDYFEGDVFHIYTNKDAKDFKFVSVPIKDPSVKNWKDVIPYNEKAYLEGIEILKNYYITQTKENGLTEIRIYDRNNKKWNKVNFGQEDYVANMYMATDDYASDSIRYYFTSLSTPWKRLFIQFKKR